MTLITDGGKKLAQVKAAWLKQVAQDDEEELKAACREIFYESMRQQIDAVNQSRSASMIDLVRGNHRILEVLWPTFK